MKLFVPVSIRATFEKRSNLRSLPDLIDSLMFQSSPLVGKGAT